MNEKKQVKNRMLGSAKELARIAVFVAMVIGAQYVFSAVPFVEIVSLLFAAYAYSFGVVRSVAAAVAFALLRQFVFGFFPVVLLLYLIYFPLLCVVFSWLGRCKISGWKLVAWATLTAVVCTVCFSLLDNLLMAICSLDGKKAVNAYFVASIPFMIGHSLCVGISVAFLFLSLTKLLLFIKKA